MKDLKVNEATEKILESMPYFNSLSCEMDPEFMEDYNTQDHKEVILNSVMRGNEFSIKTALTEIFTILQMTPFPHVDIANMASLSNFNDQTRKWTLYTKEQTRNWLEWVYKTIEEEAWKQGKLELHYKKEKWFLIYSNPPQELKYFLSFIAPRLVKIAKPKPKNVFELKNYQELSEEIKEDPKKFDPIFTDFVKISNKNQVIRILEESQTILEMKPFPENWVYIVCYSAAVYANLNERNNDRLGSAKNKESLLYFLNQLKQGAMKQGKL